jgi:phenylalanyl-tRNA synthetase beta chain
MKKYSKKWMQTFIKDTLPNNEVIAEQISKKAFEVESVEEIKDENGNTIDTLFEIKVLPNRVADAFNLRGMATEFATVLNLEMHDLNKTEMYNDISKFERKDEFVEIQNDSTKCYFGVEIEIPKQAETRPWIKEILEKSGGRSINGLVDITNLMLYSFGQPTHVFDAEKLNGKIITRHAKKGEKITLLDGKVLELTENDNLICDEKNILALAGIKGGNAAEVDENTTKAFFEIANFDRNQVRKSSVYHGVRTDASKIYENGLSVGVTEDVLIVLINTVLTEYPNAKINFVSKKYSENILEENQNTDIIFNINDVEKMAGIEIKKEEIENILKRLNFETKNNGDIFTVKAPKERLDINIKEDVLEEILRVYGFDNIPAVPLKVENNAFTHNKRFLLVNFLQNLFIFKGFTEIFNYTFVEKGDIKVLLPLAEDKSYLRTNLIDGAKNSFEKNYNYLPLLEKDIIKFFEIGNIFTKEKEEKRVVLCLEDNKKKSKNLEVLQNIITELEQILNVKINLINKNEKPAIVEFSVDEIVEQNLNISFVRFDKNIKDIKYKTISIYPFITRDIACFVGNKYSSFENLKNEIEKLNLQNVEKIYKFDEFTKTLENGESKTSIAFRIIFQSYERTLTAEEVEVEILKVYNYLKENGFEIR